MRSYYIEAIGVKSGSGNDHLSIGARFPSGIMARPLPATYITQTRLNTASKKHTLPHSNVNTELGKLAFIFLPLFSTLCGLQDLTIGNSVHPNHL